MNEMKSLKIKGVFIGIMFLIMVASMFITPSITTTITSKSTVNVPVDESLPPNSQKIHPSNWNESKKLYFTGYSSESNRVIQTNNATYTRLPMGNEVGPTNYFNWTDAVFNIYPGWSFIGWRDGVTKNAWENDGYFQCNYLDVGDKVTNAKFVIDRIYFNGLHGKSETEYASSHTYGPWIYADYGYDCNNRLNATEVDVAPPYKFFDEYGLDAIGSNTGYMFARASIYIEVSFEFPQYNAIDGNIQQLDVVMKYAMDYAVKSGHGGGIDACIVDIYNFRKGGWEHLRQGTTGYGDISHTYLPTGEPVPDKVISVQYDTFHIYDPITGNANPYFSTQKGWGTVKFLFAIAGYTQAWFDWVAILTEISIDFISVQRVGHLTLPESADLTLTINGYDSPNATYYVPDEYIISSANQVGPYTFSETYYRVIPQFYIGKKMTKTGAVLYNGTLLCGETDDHWTLYMDKTTLNKSINESGYFLQNWTYINSSGYELPAELVVYSTFNYEAMYTSTGMSNGEFHDVLPVTTYDTDFYINDMKTNTSKPDTIFIQATNKTNEAIFTPYITFPYGLLYVPIDILFSPSSTNGLIIDMYYDHTPPSTPIEMQTETSHHFEDPMLFYVKTIDDTSYCFLRINESDGTDHTYEMAYNSTSGRFEVELLLSKGNYSYFYYLVDDVGNVKTTGLINLSIYKFPLQITITPKTNQTIEVGDIILFIANVTGGIKPYTIRWYADNETITVNNYSVWLKFTEPGVYKIWAQAEDSDIPPSVANSSAVYVIVIRPSAIIINLDGLFSWLMLIGAGIGIGIFLRESGRGNTKNYLILAGVVAAGLITMSVLGLIPIQLNLLEIEKQVEQAGVYNIFTFTILGVGIAAAVIAGYFIMRKAI